MQLKTLLRNDSFRLHSRFHPTWGQLFKSGYQDSRFATQVTQSAEGVFFFFLGCWWFAGIGRSIIRLHRNQLVIGRVRIKIRLIRSAGIDCLVDRSHARFAFRAQPSGSHDDGCALAHLDVNVRRCPLHTTEHGTHSSAPLPGLPIGFGQICSSRSALHKNPFEAQRRRNPPLVFFSWLKNLYGQVVCFAYPEPLRFPNCCALSLRHQLFLPSGGDLCLHLYLEGQQPLKGKSSCCRARSRCQVPHRQHQVFALDFPSHGDGIRSNATTTPKIAKRQRGRRHDCSPIPTINKK